MSDPPRKPPILPTSQSFGHNLRFTNRLIQRDLSARVVGLGLTLGQWYALRTLWETDRITQIELAQKSCIAGPVMVTAVRELLAKGLVTRHRPRNDRRKYIICLTDRGWALQDDALKAAVEANAVALNGISAAEIATCIRVLRAAHDNLAAAAQDTASDEADRLLSRTRA